MVILKLVNVSISHQEIIASTELQISFVTRAYKEAMRCFVGFVKNSRNKDNIINDNKFNSCSSWCKTLNF